MLVCDASCLIRLAVDGDIREGNDVEARYLLLLLGRQPQWNLLERTETRAERLELSVVELLTAEAQHAVLDPRAIDLFEVAIADRR